MKWHHRIINFTLISLLLLACQSTDTAANEVDTTVLLGHWEIVNALRNNQPTESLADLFFEFKADGKMRTNLLGVAENGTYEVEGKNLLQKDTQIDVDYTIEFMADSLLILATKLKNYNFRFELEKVYLEE